MTWRSPLSHCDRRRPGDRKNPNSFAHHREQERSSRRCRMFAPPDSGCSGKLCTHCDGRRGHVLPEPLCHGTFVPNQRREFDKKGWEGVQSHTEQCLSIEVTSKRTWCKASLCLSNISCDILNLVMNIHHSQRLQLQAMVANYSGSGTWLWDWRTGLAE